MRISIASKQKKHPIIKLINYLNQTTSFPNFQLRVASHLLHAEVEIQFLTHSKCDICIHQITHTKPRRSRELVGTTKGVSKKQSKSFINYSR